MTANPPASAMILEIVDAAFDGADVEIEVGARNDRPVLEIVVRDGDRESSAEITQTSFVAAVDERGMVWDVARRMRKEWDA